ncbi:MAG: type II toxin-antitoxin system VapC family toxin [Candidatus Woesearchaeota archaeon]
MGQKVCIDTDAAIELINGTAKAAGILNLISEKEVFIATITLFELLLRKTNLKAVENFASLVELLEFDDKAARKASEITKELGSKGIQVGFRDVFIAATAVVNGCELLTLNRKDFSRIKDLHLTGE